MAAKMQLNTLTANMFVVGLLDDQYHHLQMLQKESALDFIDEVSTLFCKEGRKNIGELTEMLGKPCVDFNKVDALLCKLNGSSASVGAQRVKNRCIQFRKFYQQKSQDGCLKMLDVVRNDFYDLHIKFLTMVKLKQQSRTFYPKQ